MTCKHAQEFLGAAGTPVAEIIDANKRRIGRDEALAILDGVDRLIAMKGKRVANFDLRGGARPDDATLLSHLIGPSGNLRAPTVRVGKTLLVGFNEEAYRQVLEV